jgi:N-dimethylarginine dimethylaminohydrolase
MTPPTFLMVRPDNFYVKYSINPWMHPKEWQSSLNQTAIEQWEQLKTIIENAEGKVIVEYDKPGCPDMCFVANAGLVFNNRGLLSLFAYPERQKEEAHWHDIFDRLHLTKVQDILATGRHIPFEGAGDCLWDAQRKMFWIGYGIRSDNEAKWPVLETFGQSSVGLKLIDPLFYHLDMAMCILPHGDILWYPPAFESISGSWIKERANIPVSVSDALAFACNMVAVNDTLIFHNEMSEALQVDLIRMGYTLRPTDLSAFIKSGGAAACLTLRLDNTL